MKRMHEFLNPNVSEWRENHTGTGAMTQDGTVIVTNDEDLINANASTVYQFDHFDNKSGNYIFRLVSNEFTFPSAAIGSVKKNGVKFDVDDESLWNLNTEIKYYGAIVETGGLYAVPKKQANGGVGWELIKEPPHNYVQFDTDGYLDVFQWLKWMENYFISKGCSITADGYQAVIPGKYIEIVSDTSTGTVAKLTILPQEISVAPSRDPIFRLITTQE